MEDQRKIEDEHRKNAKLEFKKASQDRKSIKATSEQIATGEKLIELVKKDNYDKIFSVLNKLSLPNGCILEVEEPKIEGCGDISRLFVKKETTPANYDYFKDIIVEDSTDGAWQAYLLYSLRHVLPVFWHGGYETRTYLFLKQDLKDLRTIIEEHQSVVTYLVNYDLISEIIKSSHNNKYYVTYSYWTDWGELIRELIEITIDKNKVVEVFEVDQMVKDEYKCLVHF